MAVVGLGTGLAIPPASGYLPATTSHVRFTPHTELLKQEEAYAAAQRPTEQPVVGLASHIRGVFERHRRGRLEIERRMLKNLRRVNCEYEPEKLTAILSVGDPTPYPPYTRQKVQDSMSWVTQKLNPEVDRTWDIEPTPISDIPPDADQAIREQIQADFTREILSGIQQQAMNEAMQTGVQLSQEEMLFKYMPSPEELQTQYKAREAEIMEAIKLAIQELAEEKSANMEKKIQDQLTEGGWTNTFREIIFDLCNSPLCCVKGPVYRRRKVLGYIQNEQTGKWDVDIKDEIRPEFSRVAPLDYYPAPESAVAGDGDEIDVDHVSRKDLQGLMNLPGYKTEVIRKILDQYPNGYKETGFSESERFRFEKQNTVGMMESRNYDIINFWGSVPGKLLLSWGMDESKVPDPDMDYEVNAKLVGSECIKAIINPDPLGKHPYKTTSFQKSPDTQWGRCPVDLMESFQDRLNAAARALDKNTAWSSAPVTVLNDEMTRIPGEVQEVWPGKTIIVTTGQMIEGKPVEFLSHPNNSAHILRTIESIKRDADDNVIPSFAHGNAAVGGGGDTKGGLELLMSAAERNILLSVINLDMDITIPSIEDLFNHNMRFVDDDSIKGDLKVKARGAAGLMQKEVMALRRSQHLGMVVSNQTLTEIFGKKGIAYLAGEGVKALDMNIHKAIPDYDNIDEEATDAMPELMPGQIPQNQMIPADQANQQMQDMVQPVQRRRIAGQRMVGRR